MERQHWNNFSLLEYYSIFEFWIFEVVGHGYQLHDGGTLDYNPCPDFLVFILIQIQAFL